MTEQGFAEFARLKMAATRALAASKASLQKGWGELHYAMIGGGPGVQSRAILGSGSTEAPGIAGSTELQNDVLDSKTTETSEMQRLETQKKS